MDGRGGERRGEGAVAELLCWIDGAVGMQAQMRGVRVCVCGGGEWRLELC